MSPEWYYQKGDQKTGPITSKQLKYMAATGNIRPDDLVWNEGMAKPVPAKKVKGLFERTDSVSSPKLSQSNKGPKSQSVEQPQVIETWVEQPPIAEKPAPSEPFEESSETEWYYAQGDLQSGPVKLPELQELARSGKLQPSDLVWHEGLTEWVAASRIADLFSPSDLMKLKGVFGGAAEIFKQGVFESQQKKTPDAPKDLEPQTPSSEPNAPIFVETDAPPRLPNGVSENEVIAQCRVAYRGGHPQRTEAADGMLYMANNGLHLIADDPSHDFTVGYHQVLDILTPVTGSFSKEMVAKAEAARSLSQVGRHLSHFAGAFVGGVGGAAIRAIGSTASNAAQPNLGVPPKNRLAVVIVDGAVKHKLVFDVMALESTDMEQLADAFWRKAATVRSSFFNGSSRQRSAAPAPTGVNKVSQSIQPSTSGFLVSRNGVVSGPHSDADIRAMMAHGDLSAHDSIRIEVWLPIQTFSLLGMAVPGVSGAILGVSENAPAIQKPLQAQSSSSFASTTKPQRSAAPVIAAGVGGLVAGAVASSLLAPGSAHAGSLPASSHHHDPRFQGVVLDTNRDGVADTVGLDTNHDGRVDAVGIDTDGDGRADVVGVDLDHDGQIDAVGIDRDGDGRVDVYGVDSDHDGELDTFGGEQFQDDSMNIAENDYDQGELFDDFDEFA
jgi:GYF domain 2